MLFPAQHDSRPNIDAKKGDKQSLCGINCFAKLKGWHNNRWIGFCLRLQIASRARHGSTLYYSNWRCWHNCAWFVLEEKCEHLKHSNDYRTRFFQTDWPDWCGVFDRTLSARRFAVPFVWLGQSIVPWVRSRYEHCAIGDKILVSIWSKGNHWHNRDTLTLCRNVFNRLQLCKVVCLDGCASTQIWARAGAKVGFDAY